MNKVSIPHRYAENAIDTTWCASLPQKFQSLIGMLKTVWNGLEAISAQKGVSIPHRYAENGGYPHRGRGGYGVSIPHRYAENTVAHFQEWWHTGRVSIPHRYAENMSAFIFIKRVCYKFQSLIGMLKTSRRQHPICRRE